MARNVIIGQFVVTALDEEKELLVPKIGACYRSEELCRLQASQANRGYLGAEMCRSIYGWTLRYRSGLQNFAIIERFPVSAHGGDWDKSLAACKAYAVRWANEDASKRYVEISNF